MLRELIARELSSREPIRIGRDEAEALSNEVLETIDWCSARLDRDACLRYAELIRDLIRSIAAVRLRKSLNTGVRKDSLDSEVIRKVYSIAVRFYELLIGGFIDSDGRTAVLMLRSVTREGRTLAAGALVLMPAVDAVIMESVGLVKILGGITR